MYCKNCGNIVADDASSCSSCGSNPAEGSNYCPRCGHFCIPGDVECVQCKASLVSPTKLSKPLTPPQPKMQPQQKPIETKIGPKFLAADQRYCRNCGLVIPATAQKCPFCDAAGGSNYCHKCGSGTTSADTVCSVCSSPLTIRPNIGYIPSQPPAARQNVGQQTRQQYNNGQVFGNNQYNNNQSYGNGNLYNYNEPHDWLTTLLLCFFLGYLGVHRFYTKDYVIGVLQLITGGGCGIWFVIDLIMILVDSYTDGNGNKLKRS